MASRYGVGVDAALNEAAPTTTTANGNRRAALDGFASRARKYKLNPTPGQRAVLKRWFSVARRVYNLGLAALQSGSVPLGRTAGTRLRAMRLGERPQVPNQEARRGLDRHARPSLQRRPQLQAAPLAPTQDARSRPRASTAAPRRCASTRATSPTRSQPTNTYPLSTATAVWRTRGQATCTSFAPYDKRVFPADSDSEPTSGPDEKQDGSGDVSSPTATATATIVDASLRVISLDPGVRTFATGYDTGTDAAPPAVFKFGDGDFARVCRLAFHQDKLQSRMHQADVGAKRRRRMRRAFLRGNERVRNIVDSFHWALADYLTARYDVVMLPWFDSQRMAKRGRRRIMSKTVRSMLSWRHSTFRQKLACKAEERGCTLLFLHDEDLYDLWRDQRQGGRQQGVPVPVLWTACRPGWHRG